MKLTLEDYFNYSCKYDGKIVRIFNVEEVMSYYKAMLPHRKKSVLQKVEIFLHWLNGIVIYARLEGKSSDKKDFIYTTTKINEKICSEQTGLSENDIKYIKNRLKVLGIIQFSKQFFDKKSGYWVNNWLINTKSIKDYNLGYYVSAKSKTDFRSLTESEVSNIHKEFRFKEFLQILIEDDELDSVENDLGDLFRYTKEYFKDEDDKIVKQEILQSYVKRYWTIVSNYDASNIRYIFDNLDKAEVYYEDMAWCGVSEEFTLRDIASGKVSVDDIVLDKISPKFRPLFKIMFTRVKDNYSKYLRRKSLRKLAYTNCISPKSKTQYDPIVNTEKRETIPPKIALINYLNALDA